MEMTNHHHQKEDTTMGYTTPINAAPPHNIEAEQQLLGAVLTQNETYHRISDILTEEHFFDPVHARIFAACAKRIRASHMVDPVLLKIEFAEDDGLNQLGGPGYLARLAGASISPKFARDYAQIVIDAYQRRTLLDAIIDAQDKIRAGADLSEAQAAIEIAGSKVVAADTKKPTISMLGASVKAVEMAMRAYHGEAVGLKTGIKSFDDLTGGLFPEDFVVLAGAPSMGKTALAIALASAFGRQGHGSAFVSLEMGDYSVAQRMISAVCDVPYRSMRRGEFSPDQGRSMVEAAQNHVGRWPVEIVQGHVRDIAGIYAAARRIQKGMEATVPGGLRCLIVDYLQLVRAPAKDRFQVVTEVSMGLKGIAKQMGIPVIALSQINARSVSDRDDKRPKLSDLRESGQIEQDADLILFTHREHYWLERGGAPRGKNGQVGIEAQADHEAALSATKFQMDVILAKHRHDGIGEVKLGCNMATNRVWDLHGGDIQGAMGFI